MITDCGGGKLTFDILEEAWTRYWYSHGEVVAAEIQYERRPGNVPDILLERMPGYRRSRAPGGSVVNTEIGSVYFRPDHRVPEGYIFLMQGHVVVGMIRNFDMDPDAY